MSVYFRRPKTEARSLSYQDVWGSGGNASQAIGGTDIVAGGLRLIPVYASVSLISDMLATAPIAMYNSDLDGARKLLPKQPGIITDPSPYGSRIDWVHQCVASMLLRGNAYGYITALGSDGWPSKIIWLNPDAVTVIEEQNDWYHTPSYFWRGIPLDRDLVVHIPAFTMAGSVIGYSPLALFKMQIETGLRAQQFANDWFKNGANPSGHLRNSQKEIVPEQADAIKAKYKAAVANRDVLVTGNDWDYTSMSIQAEESQFLQTIRATATQVAAIYRVSPEDIGGETGTSLTYKTLTQDSTKLNIRALRPYAARIEWHLSYHRPRPQYAAFDLDFLARGDRATRIGVAGQALALGIDTIDEARAAENKAPLTPDQITQWQELYAHIPVPPAPSGDTAPPDPGSKA